MSKPRTERDDDPVQGSPPLSPKSKDPIQMTIENLVQTELTDNERRQLAAFSLFSKEVGGGAHLDQWFVHLPALSRGRALCMKNSHSETANGRRYNEMFGAWRQLYIPELDTQQVTALLWFSDDPSRSTTLAELRQTMTPGQRQRLNLPTSARKLLERTMRQKPPGDDEEKEPTWKEKAAALQDRVHRLEHDLERAERDGGSLFDLVNDPADGIGRVIVATVNPHKARNIAKAITDWLAKREPTKKPTAHAG